MSRVRTRKTPKATVLTFDDLFGEGKGAPYTGPMYLDPHFRASKMKAFPSRKQSKVVVTTRTFKEMPNGDLIMEVTRHTELAPRTRSAGKPARPKRPARA